ncbi:MAG: hypothetical protein C4B59_14485 [Candidatus Methanogaster sp.]|uniref:Uncharacterized protein n=1 Tax=Candidatus Methanogaster sp. TaxID=3386292 RepID=A0AC61KZD9_9EURY|nr:MAG: hypothetical protein C4B59_14485 [ANME-2 cluster archaeon]
MSISSVVKYPYSKRYLLTFDCEVVYPEIPISLQTKYGVIEEMFLMDTGADITTLPNYARYLFEETPAKCDHEMYGVGGSSRVWKSVITIKLAGEWIPVRCIFAEHDDIPFILGRLDVSGQFNMRFDETEIHIERWD